MIKRKKSKSKDKPEKKEDDIDLNSTIEDLEILEMTERTLVVSGDEETIDLNSMENEEFNEIDAEDGQSADAGVEEDSYVWEDEAEDVDVATLNPEATILAPEDAQPETAGAQSAEPKSPKKSQKAKPEAASKTKEEETTDRGKSSQILIFVLIATLAAVVGGGVVFFLQKSGGPEALPPEKVAQTVVQPAARSVAQTEPEPTPQFEEPSFDTTEPESLPQPATPPPAPVAAEPESASQPTTPPPAPVVAEPEATAPVAANAKAARALRDIGFKEVGKTLQMKIVTDGVVKKYDAFPLSGPTRLVVDLFGKWDKPPFTEKQISSTSRVSRIRLGKHDDKLRIVVDFSREQDINTAFTATPDGLIVAITMR